MSSDLLVGFGVGSLLMWAVWLWAYGHLVRAAIEEDRSERESLT